MSAIDLANRMNENTHSISRVDAIAAGKMLRRQHEAILKLRDALEMIDDTCMGGSRVDCHP